MTRLTHADELRLDAAAKRQELADTLDQLMAKAHWRTHVSHGRHRRIVRLAATTAGAALVATAIALGALSRAARRRAPKRRRG